MHARGRWRGGRVAAALFRAALRAALFQGACACSRIALSLPRENSSALNAAHPTLVYTGPLPSLPLGLLASQPGLALAMPSGQDASTEHHIRDALRAAVHVVLRQESSDLFRSATGRNALVVQDPAGGPAFISLHVATATESNRVLFNEEATQYIKQLSEYDASMPQMSALEAALSDEEIHCAYGHWACDYVARGEVLWPLCQRLRSAYFRATRTDIFKFGPRASKVHSAPKSASGKQIVGNLVIESTEQSRHRPAFIDRNRARIEDAYQRLVSESGKAAAPIRQILFVLFGASDDELKEARLTPSGLDELLELSGASAAYQSMGEPDLRRVMRLFGILLVLFGSRGCLLALLKILNSSEASADAARQKRSWRTTPHGIPDEKASVSFSKFLANRAQSISKTS